MEFLAPESSGEDSTNYRSILSGSAFAERVAHNPPDYGDLFYLFVFVAAKVFRG